MKLLAWLILGITIASAEPDWVLEGAAPWQARDSQAEWVFKDKLWIGGGWFQSFEEPPRDVWASADGKAWSLIEKSAPWLHSDLPMNVTFADKMWIMGGWHKGRLPGHSASNQVWSSVDGVKWEQVTASAGWSPRLAAALVEHGLVAHLLRDHHACDHDYCMVGTGRLDPATTWWLEQHAVPVRA